MTHLMARGGPPGRRAIKWVIINAPWLLVGQNETAD